MMKRRAVLVYPKTGEHDFIVKDLPLSLIYVASIAKSKGFDIKIIDQRIEKNWKALLIKELKDNPLCVGVSVMTGRPIRYALEISRIVKEYSRAPVVWGGVHPTLLPQQTLQHQDIDIVIRGKGELVFYELLKALCDGVALGHLPGVCFKEQGDVIVNPTVAYFDINDLPELPYDLIQISDYSRPGLNVKVFPLVTSYGCPYHCSFCVHSAIYGSFWQAEKMDRTLSRLDDIVAKYHPDRICFLDNSFFADILRAEKMFNEIKKFKWKLTFESIGVRIDEIDGLSEGMLALMEEIGFSYLHIGVESGSQRILNTISKGITVEQIVRVNRKLNKFRSIRPLYNFMCGIPTETHEDLRRTTDMVFLLMQQNRNCYIKIFNQYVPFPGTKLFDLSLDCGFSPPGRLQDWQDFDATDSSKHFPWINPRERRFLRLLYLCSFFLDRKIDREIKSRGLIFKILRFIAYLYKPLARWRVKNNIDIFPVELYFQNFFYRYLDKFI